MTVGQVENFIAESVNLNWPWEFILLHGGEPTIHPQIKEMCRLLAEYKKLHNEKCSVAFCTNYAAKASQDLVVEMKELYGVGVFVAEKHNGAPCPYVATNESPADLGLPFQRGCFVTSDCGICLNSTGYFQCSPAAAASRVFIYGPVATTLADVTVEKMQARFEQNCAHCGWSTPDRRRVTKQVTTKTWREAFGKYLNTDSENIEPVFDRDCMEGQLSIKERRLLYRTIREERPRIVFEIGTWNGGGSTYFLLSALYNNDRGQLYTTEADKEHYEHAVELYQKGDLAYLGSRVTFYNHRAVDIINLLSVKSEIDIMLIDGSDDPTMALYEFAYARRHIPIDGLVICHDWGEGKTSKLKPVLENDSDFAIHATVDTLAIYRRISKNY
jgi:hypothetical protein